MMGNKTWLVLSTPLLMPQAILEFPVACGISVGTPVRIRGVPVGGVLSVQPSLERVDVLVEIRDTTTVIPRNSLIEANQSGLIAEPLIDITPQLPVPQYTGGWGGWASRSVDRGTLRGRAPAAAVCLATLWWEGKQVSVGESRVARDSPC